MNEEELQLMVSRARDAEGSPSQPPPGLVDEARTAARRRRTLMSAATGGVVAAVIAAGVAVPRLVSDDPTPEGPLVGVSDELSEHGGPCPAVLPEPTNGSGQGFATSAVADEEPRFTSPDAAWVCQYGATDIGRTENGEMEIEWRLDHTPRRLDDSLLPQVTEGLQSIELRDPEPLPCTMELGPQWMLVTSNAGDLTGAVADGYGCRDVRLTDDPFVTAPGDPQEGGTVPGVLVADGLAGTLETWWDTSPADVENSPTPAELRVTCTDDGPQVESTTVEATPAGVVVVVDSTMAKGSYLTYTSDGLSGGDRLDEIANPATYTFPPGELTLGCASPPGMDEIAPVTVEVVDAHGYWRTSTIADFGCGPGGAQPSWKVGNGTGATPEGAVDALLDQLKNGVGLERRDYSAEPAPTGYSGSDTQTWVASKRGTPDFSVLVTQTGSTFTADPGVLCARTE